MEYQLAKALQYGDLGLGRGPRVLERAEVEMVEKVGSRHPVFLKGNILVDPEGMG